MRFFFSILPFFRFFGLVFPTIYSSGLPTLKPPISQGSPIVVFYEKLEKKKLMKNRIFDANRHKPISDS